jgi:hypothetical protein
MREFADAMRTLGNNVLAGESLAVHYTVFDLSGLYGFNAIIDLRLDPSTSGKAAYGAIYILAKK